MHKQNTCKIWFAAFLSISFVTGCGDCRNPDLTSPTVLSVSPPNVATGVCPNSVVTATFSEAMNVASINSATFTVSGVTGTITHDASNTVFTFTPSSPLAVSTVYTATITTGVRDLFGNSLASNFVWSFTTAANGCNPPPTVLSVTPPNASTGVCSNSVVTATFSEAMNVASINSATFTVSGVTGTITHDASNTVFTFTPSSPLAVSTVYTATLTTGVRDLFGNSLASNFVWSFTTAANGCNPPPTVLSVTPPNASTGVCSNSVVTATFSEAMNVASINSATFTVSGVTGTITHDASNTVFTFTPSSPLAVSTVYTATSPPVSAICSAIPWPAISFGVSPPPPTDAIRRPPSSPSLRPTLPPVCVPTPSSPPPSARP